MEKAIVKRKDDLAPSEQAELGDIAERVRGRLQQTALGVIQIGADLARAKELLGHGHFGEWIDAEFGLGRRSAEQFMAAFRRFGSKSEIVSHLPAGAVLELSAPSVPDELVQRVIAGEVPASPAAIRREKSTERTNERSYDVGNSFIEQFMRFKGDRHDFAAGVAAHVIRKWKNPEDRAWFGRAMQTTTEMIEDNLETRVPLLELPRTTVRKIREQS
jgi:hypothetical protein